MPLVGSLVIKLLRWHSLVGGGSLELVKHLILPADIFFLLFLKFYFSSVFVWIAMQ